MSASHINTLLDLWAASLRKHNATPPFANSSDLYNTIDSAPLGDVPWQSFSLCYNGELLGDNLPPSQWMLSEYDVWFRDPHVIVKNMIDNPDYNHQFDTTPVRDFDHNGKRKYQHFMSGDWAWDEAASLTITYFISPH
jgi:Plavaka transposase